MMMMMAWEEEEEQEGEISIMREFAGRQGEREGGGGCSLVGAAGARVGGHRSAECCQGDCTL